MLKNFHSYNTVINLLLKASREYYLAHFRWASRLFTTQRGNLHSEKLQDQIFIQQAHNNKIASIRYGRVYMRSTRS